MGACKDFIVDMVNPRFRWFDKPLCLAILVGLCTYVLVALVFLHSSEVCTTTSESLMYSSTLVYESTMEHWASTKPGLSCVHFAKMMYHGTRGNKTGEFVRDCKPVLPDSVRRCTHISENLEAAVKKDKNWRSASEKFELGDRYENLPSCGSRDSLWVPISYSARPVVEFEVCPDFWTTFGAALGWTSIIEVAVTVLVVGCLRCMGCLKGRRDSQVGQWLVEMTKESLQDLEVIEGMEVKIKDLDAVVQALKADFYAAGKEKDEGICEAA